MALEGLQTEAIACRLSVSGSTVRQHCMNAYRKLGVSHAVPALVVCFNAGWIDPMQTEIQDPTRYPDARVTERQRVYLEAFGRHLAAGDDYKSLRDAKRRTDVAAVHIGHVARSDASRDWMDGLVTAMARLPEPSDPSSADQPWS